MHKKANLHIWVFVMMTLFACVIAFSGIYAGALKVKINIYDASFLKEVYTQEDSARFYLRQVGERAFVETYQNFVSDGDYGVSYNLNKEVKLGELNELWKENFKEFFEENFKNEFVSYNFREDYLKDVKDLVEKNNFEVGNDFAIVVNGIKFEEDIESVGVIYFPELEIQFDFEKLGLMDFDELYKSKVKCQSAASFEDCLNKELKNFNVDVLEKTNSDASVYSFVSLESKKEFFTGSGFEKIKFGFVLV